MASGLVSGGKPEVRFLTVASVFPRSGERAYFLSRPRPRRLPRPRAGGWVRFLTVAGVFPRSGERAYFLPLPRPRAGGWVRFLTVASVFPRSGERAYFLSRPRAGGCAF